MQENKGVEDYSLGEEMRLVYCVLDAIFDGMDAFFFCVVGVVGVGET